jgi:hypothetical protein
MPSPIDDSVRYFPARIANVPPITLPPDRRLTRGWTAFPISPSGESVHLRWDALAPADFPQRARLRVSVAVDEREEKWLEAFLPRSGRVIGTFDIRYAHIFQPFEIMLSGKDVREVTAQGVYLRLVKGNRPLWLHGVTSANASAEGLCAAMMPHLVADPMVALTAERALGEMVARLASLASLQFFGWQEGCVLNGLFDLADRLSAGAAHAAISDHLRFFFDEQQRLSYVDDWSRPADGTIYGIECTLPFAVLAQIDPAHPALREAVAFWQAARNAEGAVQDTEMLSAEGNYTVAYPMTVLANILGQPDMTALALDQLRLRRDRLFVGDSFYLRVLATGERTFRNWCRGVAWYLLGLTRTLCVLPTPPSDLVTELGRAAAWIVKRQLPSGTWATFVDEPAILPDTSGSAGIAAALALGVRHGLLPAAYRAHAQRALESLVGYLTPDGFLTGVSQVNKAGESLQRGAYRVISQMGMGLLAQLVAALDAPFDLRQR